MPTRKVPKTLDEYIESGIKMYRTMPQFREETDEELYGRARVWAEKQLDKRVERAEAKRVAKQTVLESDEEFRSKQEAHYRTGYIWEGANDESSLQHLLNLEVEMRRVKSELDEPRDDRIKKDLRKSLTDLSTEHRTLQEKLGIDRLTRAKAESARSTVDDWDRIKREAKEKLVQLASEFDAKANQATTEAELRDRLKYHFAIPFDMVDSVLRNHRRVLGLPLDVQES
jgi:hypothetical protein